MVSEVSEKQDHTERPSRDAPPGQDGAVRKDVLDLDVNDRSKLNAVFENPLAGIPKETLLQNVEDFCREHDLMEQCDIMKRGALASQSPWNIDEIPELTQEDKEILEHEKTHKWDQPWMLYWLVCKSAVESCCRGWHRLSSFSNGFSCGRRPRHG
jgi:hypothetical protein